MKRFSVGLLLLVSVLLLGLFLAWQSLPTIVQALPGQFRVRLPEELLRAVTTPLPSALPAPSIVAEAVQLTAESVITNPIEFNTSTPTTEPKPPTSTTSSKPLAATPTLAPTRQPPTVTPTATVTVIPIPTAVHLKGMGLTPQSLNNCGPTNLSINLNYYGMDTDQFDVANVVKPHFDDRNVSPYELVDYTNNHTQLRANLYAGGDLLLLKQLLAAGFPVVIEKGYEPDWQGWMGHYLTLVGYDETAETFITMDTFLGPWDATGKAYSYEIIEEYWQHFNNTFFVVYPPEKKEELLEITGPDLNDPMLMWQHAALQAQESIDANPENEFAWFNLGTSYTQLGHLTADPQLYHAAATAFDQARLIGLPPRMLWYQFQLYEAYLAVDRAGDVLTLTTLIRDHQGGDKVEETFYYRGLAQEARGNAGEAALNYQRALEIQPNFTAARAALDSLTN